MPQGLFETELDRYERVMERRVGVTAAFDARREMEAHLDADFHARLEAGLSFDAARRGALAALGDLETVAAVEPAPTVPLWLSLALPGSTTLMAGSWFVVGLNAGTPRLVLTVMAAVWMVAAFFVARKGEARRSPALWTAALLPALFALAAYLPIFSAPIVDPAQPIRRISELLLVVAILAATGLSVGVGAVRRRADWTLVGAMGTAIFLAQTAGVEISVRASGAHPSYPFDVTLGTWVAFTLPLLILSAVAGAAATAIGRGLASVREAAR